MNTILRTTDPEHGFGGNNRNFVSDPTLDAMLAKVDGTFDDALREKLTQDAVHRAMEQQDVLPLFFVKASWGIRKDLTLIRTGRSVHLGNNRPSDAVASGNPCDRARAIWTCRVCPIEVYTAKLGDDLFFTQRLRRVGRFCRCDSRPTAAAPDGRSPLTALPHAPAITRITLQQMQVISQPIAFQPTDRGLQFRQRHLGARLATVAAFQHGVIAVIKPFPMRRPNRAFVFHRLLRHHLADALTQTTLQHRRRFEHFRLRRLILRPVHRVVGARPSTGHTVGPTHCSPAGRCHALPVPRRRSGSATTSGSRVWLGCFTRFATVPCSVSMLWRNRANSGSSGWNTSALCSAYGPAFGSMRVARATICSSHARDRICVSAATTATSGASMPSYAMATVTSTLGSASRRNRASA